MTDNKQTEAPEIEDQDEQDVEGHNMWVSSTVATDLARNRAKELEKEARDHRRAQENKKER
jgi:hypothetical protein